ncbi:DUF1294 domain-containing protein [Deinococcus oregonensis]|uniref:DUF1294 domain-containing protein n=1 Tax=Deinococcus oregonensis TaxID=1805970 RepID=A0ABV6AXX8_9DEIO
MRNAVDLIASLFVVWQALWSLVAFVAIWHDKNLASGHRWRTPEDKLHSYEFWGGWLGSGLAQWLWRHKTYKASYQQVYRRTAGVWLAASLIVLGVWIVARLNA